MQCRIGYSLIQGSCWAQCPTGTIPANEDYTKCVLDVPCTTPNLIQDTVFSMQCNKVGVPKAVTCATNFYEWQNDYCFINCPSTTMVENGLSCIKKSVPRLYENPTCPFLFLYWGSECVINPLSLFLVFGLFTFLVYKFLYKQTKKFSF